MWIHANLQSCSWYFGSLLWDLILKDKKEICDTFFFLNCNIWGKTETYLVSFCLNSFRDLTLQITFNSRDRSTLNEILSLIGQSCVWQIFLINSDHFYTSERKMKWARRIISRNLTSWQENEKLWCVLKFLETWMIVTSIFQERNGERVNVFSCPYLKLKNSMIYTNTKIRLRCWSQNGTELRTLWL